MSKPPEVLGWDCHNHLFGPYARFPLAADRSYTPPEALEDGHAEMLRRQGLSHAVLVHPSAYGDDHSLLLSALDAHPHLRGVIVVRPDSPLVHAGLASLRPRGVRAARFSHRSGAGTNFAGSASIEDLQALGFAIVGYGSQGHAHALNLKDSGYDVVIGSRSKYRAMEARDSQVEKWPDLAPRLAAMKREALLSYGALIGAHGRLVHQRWIN